MKTENVQSRTVAVTQGDSAAVTQCRPNYYELIRELAKLLNCDTSYIYRQVELLINQRNEAADYFVSRTVADPADVVWDKAIKIISNADTSRNGANMDQVHGAGWFKQCMIAALEAAKADQNNSVHAAQNSAIPSTRSLRPAAETADGAAGSLLQIQEWANTIRRKANVCNGHCDAEGNPCIWRLASFIQRSARALAATQATASASAPSQQDSAASSLQPDPKCLKCGHDLVGQAGQCLVVVSSDSGQITDFCGCKCVFPTASPKPATNKDQG